MYLVKSSHQFFLLITDSAKYVQKEMMFVLFNAN